MISDELSFKGKVDKTTKQPLIDTDLCDRVKLLFDAKSHQVYLLNASDSRSLYVSFLISETFINNIFYQSVHRNVFKLLPHRKVYFCPSDVEVNYYNVNGYNDIFTLKDLTIFQPDNQNILSFDMCNKYVNGVNVVLISGNVV